MTGRNTSIAPSKLGPMRFPPRDPEPPAEIKVYHLPVEELIKKYGPPKRPLQHRNYDGAIDYHSIAAAIRTSAGPEEAAVLGLKLEDLRRYIRHYKIQPRYGLAIKKEENEMAFEVYKDVNSKNAADNQAQAEKKQESAPVANRLTVARAVEMREEAIEDLDDLNRIIDLATSDCTTPPSDRVMKLLNWHRDQFRLMLDRIDQAFSNTEVVL
ncbi:hypothetical protein Pmgp_03379 [Pelotomaculum propionicicum]|uniref:Uncharacterized protein n=2 Tax=Pelotomaculum propionicicum TaxID=258475 RepID=A0A4Y7RJJ0_9FIRM|nr:hypothetical protein Pmgp_03379 [Pelotomaculum propionicicum]